MIYKKLKTALLLGLLLSTPLSSFAVDGEGTNSGGGGNAVGHQLLDFYENSGSVQIKVQETEAYKRVLEPIISGINQNYFYNFRSFVLSGVDQKIWLLEPKAVRTDGCQNESIVIVKAQVVACQSEFEVRISKQWYEDKNTDLKNKAGLLLHEMYVAKTIGAPIAEKAEREKLLRMVVRMTFDPNTFVEPLQVRLFADLVFRFSDISLKSGKAANAIAAYNTSLKQLAGDFREFCTSQSNTAEIALQEKFFPTRVTGLSQYSYAVVGLNEIDPNLTSEYVSISNQGAQLIDVRKMANSKAMEALGIGCGVK